MAAWKHTLKLKDLLDRDTEDHDAHACKIGPEAASRVMALSKRIARRDDMLATDLEEIADGFSAVPEDDEPVEAFDGVLSDLYDLGDRYRIWIA